MIPIIPTSGVHICDRGGQLVFVWTKKQNNVCLGRVGRRKLHSQTLSVSIFCLVAGKLFFLLENEKEETRVELISVFGHLHFLVSEPSTRCCCCCCLARYLFSLNTSSFSTVRHENRSSRTRWKQNTVALIQFSRSLRT